MLKVYRNNQKIGFLPNDETDTIARWVAGISQKDTEKYVIVNGLDLPVIEMLGNIVAYVPDQDWLAGELLPLLNKYDNQTFEKVELVSELE